MTDLLHGQQYRVDTGDCLQRLRELPDGCCEKLSLVPISRAEAHEFVRLHHRHHKPGPGDKFCIAVADDTGEVRGVAIVGRPVARALDDGWTLEVTRLCTDGAKNACSMLYGAAARAAFAMGYKRIGTYTLPEEGGASLRASGWTLVGEAGGGSWSRSSRPRVDKHPTAQKLRWERRIAGWRHKPRRTRPQAAPDGQAALFDETDTETTQEVVQHG